ncbi:hypothetical protein KR032_000142 [Drosophila birchii]|nr:hypothetical protein KR032_000142 [Drosophila birchii]
MTPAKWYLLCVTGSLNTDKTYVPRYLDEAERRLIPMRCSRWKIHTPRISPTDPNKNKGVGVSKKKGKLRGKGKKLPKCNKVTKTDPENLCPGKEAKSLSIPDSPQMLEFFEEVRRRQLRDYYLRMKAGKRCSRVFAICTNDKPPSQNIYCAGPKSIKQELQNIEKDNVGERFGDYIWLWSSYRACPDSALRSECCSGGGTIGM